MTGLGAPVNNRQGVSVNADVELGRLKLNGGLGVFGEIDTSRAGVSYVHQVNGQTLSRIYLFAQDWGPYNALNSMYRGVFENVDILDTSATGMAGFKKFFSTAELQAKYQTRWGDREVHLFSLSRLNSCQRSPSLTPVLGREAVLSQFSQEFDASLSLSEDAVLVLGYGIERVIGNEVTNLGDAGTTSPTSVLFDWLGAESLYHAMPNATSGTGCSVWARPAGRDRAMLFEQPLPLFRSELHREQPLGIGDHAGIENDLLMKLVRVLPFLLALLLTGSALLAQTGETVWFDGQSRSFFSRDALGEMDRPDTTSPRNLSEGYNLLDINTHIEPADNLEVFAQLRVRNRFGGFFGAGTTIDVRQ